MSDQEEVNNIRVEIQKLLKTINKDMTELKSELSSINSFIEDNVSLPMLANMVNEKLKVTAKEAGIDLESLSIVGSVEDSEEGEASENANAQQSNSNVIASTSNATKISAATKELTQSIKHVVK